MKVDLQFNSVSDRRLIEIVIVIVIVAAAEFSKADSVEEG